MTGDVMNKTKNTFRNFISLGAVGNYFLRLFGKKDPDKPSSINLTLMHGINRIAVIVFILALLFFVGRKIFF